MKRIVCCLISFFSIFIILSATCVVSFASGFKGDVNKDGACSIIDAKWILQKVADIRSFDSQQLEAADMNNDGDITIVDAKWVLQVVAGLKERPELKEPIDILRDKLSQAEKIDLEFYTEDTAQALSEAIATGKAVAEAESPSPEQLDKAITDIENALASLKSLRQCLAETVAIAQEYDLTGCEESLKEKLRNKIASANDLIENEQATPNRLRNMNRSILKVFDEIELYKQELSEIKQTLADEIERLKAVDTSQVREGSAIVTDRIAAFNDEIAIAQELYNNSETTKSMVEKELKKLTNAEQALRTYKEVFYSTWKIAVSYYNEARSGIPADKLKAAKDTFREVINRTGAIYDAEGTTDEDYLNAINELSDATKAYADFCAENSRDAIIDWT